MGWSFYNNDTTKEYIINHLLNDDTWHKPVTHSLRGNHLWVVFENTNPEYTGTRKYICLFLLECHEGCWGYKDITETCGPYETDCPVRFFDQVPDPGGFATEWRARVMADAETKRNHGKLVRSLRVGMIVRLRSRKPDRFQIANLKPLRGYADNGMLYRLKPSYIDRIEQA